MTIPSETSGREHDHDVSSFRFLTPASVEKLRSRWIATVEQLVATAATAQGRKGLESLLGVTPEAIEILLKEAWELLGCERYKALMQVKPGGSMGARYEDSAFNPGESKGGKA